MPGTDDRLQKDTASSAAHGWEGREVIGKHGERLGVIRALYAQVGSDTPLWAAVRTGLFGTKETLVPIAEAQANGEQVQVPFAKEDIRGAPRIEPDDALSWEQERELYRHYRMEYPPAGPEPAIGGQSTDEAMTRSEEEVHVGTDRRERGRVRLRKYVVTEEVRRTLPVRREEARIEREPITDENIDAAMAGPEISTGEHEVVLHEDVPVVEKRVVPKERVRMEKETRVEEEKVSDEVRKERIEAEGDLDR